MSFERMKAAVKSRPFLYNVLRSVMVPFGPRREMDRLRSYCAQRPRWIREPVFVKVGANDGVTGDPVSDILLSNPKWKGLLIEPVPYCFEA